LPTESGRVSFAINASDAGYPIGRRSRTNRSIFDGKTLPDFIDPLVKRIEASVKTSVVKIKNIAASEESENPVVSFHIDHYLLDRMTHKHNNIPQSVHRIPR
jgi:hypothetical protein